MFSQQQLSQFFIHLLRIFISVFKYRMHVQRIVIFFILPLSKLFNENNTDTTSFEFLNPPF